MSYRHRSCQWDKGNQSLINGRGDSVRFGAKTTEHILKVIERSGYNLKLTQYYGRHRNWQSTKSGDRHNSMTWTTSLREGGLDLRLLLAPITISGNNAHSRFLSILVNCLLTSFGPRIEHLEIVSRRRPPTVDDDIIMHLKRPAE